MRKKLAIISEVAVINGNNNTVMHTAPHGNRMNLTPEMLNKWVVPRVQSRILSYKVQK